MVDIQIRVKAASTIEAMQKLAKKSRSLKKPLRKSGLFLEREVKLNFAHQSDPDGKPWAPLKPSTLRRKKTTAILRETGALAASIAMEGPVGNQVRVVAGQAYGIWLQTGTRKMVARPFLGISEERHIPKIRKIFESHFESK